ncbi:hypothetical protein APHAL10511_002150 [Amanita phalloides]|nr:hypothetical protein APHAL10511_002150 [Amanita phalloides]
MTHVVSSARPAAHVQTDEYRKMRPEIVGLENPEPPFPITIAGNVQKGFGRGGKELGCPTANLQDEAIASMNAVTQTGVYYGYAQLIVPQNHQAVFGVDDLKVFPMAMSLGRNLFYKNERLSAEVHIMHDFKTDFYGYELRVVVLGYIRPELDYTSRDALIEDIEFDKKVALKSLDRPAYREYIFHPHFKTTKRCSKI